MAHKLYAESGTIVAIPVAANTLGRNDYTIGDKEASELPSIIGLSGLKIANASDTIRVIKLAKRLFGGNSLCPFFGLNFTHNHFKSQLHYEFFVDTCNYIITGKRAMSIRMWTQQLTSKGYGNRGDYSSEFTYTMKSHERPLCTLSNWLSHKDGIVDLVFTMYILFGAYTTERLY